MDAQPWDAEVEKVTVHSLQAILLVAWSARCGLKSRAICIHIRPEAKKHGFLRPGLDDRAFPSIFDLSTQDSLAQAG